MKFVLVTLYSLLFTTVTMAASFDCAKASTNVEKIICSNPVIGQLDVDLSIVYKEARLNNESIVQEQRDWMRKRNNCKEESCVEDIYRLRISELSNTSINNSNIDLKITNNNTADLLINKKESESINDIVDVNIIEDQGGIIEYAPFILLAMGVFLWIMIFRHIKYLHTMYGGKYVIALILSGFAFGGFTSNKLNEFVDEVIAYHMLTIFLLILYFIIKLIIAVVTSDEFKKGFESANYQIGGKKTGSSSSAKYFGKPIFGGVDPPKSKVAKKSVFRDENKINDSSPQQKSITPISASNKVCATCGLWGGDRDIDSGRIVVRVSGANSKGKCMGGGHNQQQISATGTCRMHEKWSALK